MPDCKVAKVLAPEAVMGFGVCRLTRCLLDVSLGFAVAANVGSRKSFTEVDNYAKMPKCSKMSHESMKSNGM